MIYILNDFCTSTSGYKLMGFLGMLLMIIKICIPIILVIVGIIGIIKCIISHDNSKMSGEIKKMGIKLVIGVFIFFLPSIVISVFNFVNENVVNTTCMTCLLNTPSECIERGNNLESESGDSLCSSYDNKPESCKSPCEYNNGRCQGKG